MATSQNKEKFEDYDGFVEKFKRKLTTDDCYTPQNVYDEVLAWVDEKITPLAGRKIIRPFWPDANYQEEEYPEGCIVIDNPPFSMLSKICRWYNERGIKYFLFAPSLTLFSSPNQYETYIVANSQIIFENGANINISFRTNLKEGVKIMVAGDLNKRLAEVQNKPDKRRRGVVYPDYVISSATLGRLAHRGINLEFKADECFHCAKLDNAKGTIYGGGYLLSERAAAERAAAERAAAERAAAERAAAEVIQLSERELNIIKQLGKNG